MAVSPTSIGVTGVEGAGSLPPGGFSYLPNINSASTPGSLIQQAVNSAEGRLISSVTSKINNPALAGAAASLLGALFGSGIHDSAIIDGAFPDTISNIANLFTELNLNREFARTCRYLVDIPSPRCILNAPAIPGGYNFSSESSSLRYACNAAELPGVTITPLEFRHYAFMQRIAHHPTFTPVTFNFYCFGGMQERAYFEYWANSLVSFQSGLVNYPQDAAGNPQTTTSITVTQYANDNTPIYKVTMFDAFPINIGPMTLNWADDRVHELSITFGYTKWRTSTTDANIVKPVAPGTLSSKGVSGGIEDVDQSQSVAPPSI
jgi:hypothetical protein